MQFFPQDNKSANQSEFKPLDNTCVFDCGFVAAIFAAISLSFAFSDLRAFDFEFIWHSAYELWNGINPYLSNSRIISLNSPVGLGMLCIWGLIPFSIARHLYIFTMFFALFWSMWICLKIYRMPSQYPIVNLALLLLPIPIGLFFQVLVSGSLIVFPVLGLCIFFCLDIKKKPLLAGFCLSLCLIKPHLFVLVVAWTFWWAWKNRILLLPVGLFIGALIGTITALLIQNDIFNMYIGISGHKYFVLPNASLGNLLYRTIEHKSLVILFVPLVLSLGIMHIYRARLISISVKEMVALLIPWSIFMSPYCWSHDYWPCLYSGFLAAYQIKKVSAERITPAYAILALALGAQFMVGLWLRLNLRHEKFLLYGLLAVTVAGLALMNQLKTEKKAS